MSTHERYIQVALGIECDGEWISIADVCARLNKAEAALAEVRSVASDVERLMDQDAVISTEHIDRLIALSELEAID